MRPTPSPGTRREIAARRRNPVFVDGSGRRARRVRILSFAAVGVVGAYLIVVALSLLGVPTIVSPLLPQPFAASGAADLPEPTPSSPPPSEPAQPSQPTVDAPSDATTIVLPTDTASSTTPGAESATVSPTVATTDPAETPPGNAPADEDRGNRATAPGQSTAPGQTAAPTPPAHP